MVFSGGVEILEECQRYLKTVGSEIQVGDIFVSSAGKLSCKNVIHAIGPRWKYGDAEEKCQLTDCVRKSMIEASNREFQSIAFPAISSGNKGYPVQMSTFIILDAIYSYLDDEKSSSLKEVYLVDIDESAVQSFKRKLHLLQASRDAELNVGHHSK